MAETLHNDINKVADMLLIGKDEFLKFYSYLSEEDYNITINQILYNLFSYTQRQEYVEYLISEGQEDYAKKILPEHFMSDNKEQNKPTPNVYKVSDDEWEDIMGSEQLRSFALDQMIEKINTSDDEEIAEDIDSDVTDKYKDKVRELFKLYSDDKNVEEQLTDKLAIEVLKLRYFDVEKLHIR